MRTIGWIITLVFFLAFLFFIFVYFNGSFIFAKILEKQFGVPVAIERVRFDYHQMNFKNCIVSNPKKGTSPYALRLEYTEANCPLINYIKDPTYIESVKVNNVDLFMEYYPNGNTNWSILSNSMQKHEKMEQKEKGPNQYALIRNLIIENIHLYLVHPHKKTEKYPIDKLSFQNVRTDKNDITDQIMRAILYKIIFNYKNIIETPLNWGKEISDGINKMVSPLFSDEKQQQGDS